MLKQAALEYGRALADFAQLECNCHHLRLSHPQLHYEQTGKLQELAQHALGNLKRVCILTDLQEVLPEIERFGTRIAGKMTIEDVKSSAHHLRYRVLDELASDHFFQVDRADVRFYGQPHLFGEAVSKKFKAAKADIEAAGNCIALQQPTACVFHLMRAMEVAVQTLAKRLGITIGPKTTWRVLTGNMDDKIKKMPDSTHAQQRKKHDWEAARANLHAVGSVWRNNTMHPASSYTRSQARDVFDATRVFMSSLCAL